VEISRRNLFRTGAGLSAAFFLGIDSKINSPAVATDVFTSLAELQSAIDSGKAGAIYTLANGVYKDGSLSIRTSGISIKAQTAGGVIFTGTNSISLKADHCTLQGIRFIDGAYPGIVIRVYGSNNLLQDLAFKNYSSKKYINIEAGATDNEISYCSFEAKPVNAPSGNLVGVIPDPNVVGYNRIRFCSFKNNPGRGGDNGNEPIRLGEGALSQNISRTVIEYCYWENTGAGDSENISIKCRENIVRYCTFSNNQDGALVFRNGDRNMAYGNSFINAGGIRIKEANEIFCFDNYFENSGVNGRANAVTFEYLGNNLRNITMVFNTFVNCGDIVLGGEGPSANVWANNLFVKGSGAIFQQPNSGTTWLGNQYQGTLGIPVTKGLKSIDPKLARTSDGYLRPTLRSPMRSSAISGSPIPTAYEGLIPQEPFKLDLMGRLRPLKVSQWDIGAISYVSKPLPQPPLTGLTSGARYS